MLPLTNSKNNKNTGQNWSTYSFTITKRKAKRYECKSKRMDGVEMFVASPRVCRAA